MIIKKSKKLTEDLLYLKFLIKSNDIFSKFNIEFIDRFLDI